LEGRQGLKRVVPRGGPMHLFAVSDATVRTRPRPHRWESDMPLMTLLLTLVVIGVLLWLVNTYIPMDGKIKQILNVVAAVCTVVWVLNMFGLFSHLGNIQVGKN
jgi:hypothetical protein